STSRRWHSASLAVSPLVGVLSLACPSRDLFLKRVHAARVWNMLDALDKPKILKTLQRHTYGRQADPQELRDIEVCDDRSRSLVIGIPCKHEMHQLGVPIEPLRLHRPLHSP